MQSGGGGASRTGARGQSALGRVSREASPFEALARKFKISPIVAARRALDLNLVDRDTFFDFYER